MKPWPALAVMALALLCTGCAGTGQPAAPGVPGRALETSVPPAAGLRLYEDASAALLAGRPAEAARLFAALAQGEDPVLARQARYGQAAAALAGARTPAEAQAALARWQAWRREAPPAPASEDPRLLAPLVEGLGACIAARDGQAGREEMERLKAKNAKLGAENAQLKQQLQELEALQRELSQRKNRLNR